jgi:hypothetical protein
MKHLARLDFFVMPAPDHTGLCLEVSENHARELKAVERDGWCFSSSGPGWDLVEAGEGEEDFGGCCCW